MKNPIEITALMIFSMGYFIIGVLNWVYDDPTFTYRIFSLLNNCHIFEISLAVGLAVSIVRNYRRASTDSSKMLSKTAFLTGIDLIFMLLGVFASLVVLSSFTYSQDYSLHLISGAFGIAAIGINLCRKQFLDFLACRIP